MVVEVDVEGRNALIGRGEAVFFWIAWRQASRMWLRLGPEISLRNTRDYAGM